MSQIGDILETIDQLYNKQAERFFKNGWDDMNAFLATREEQAVLHEIVMLNGELDKLQKPKTNAA